MKTAKEAKDYYNRCDIYEIGQKKEGWQIPRLVIKHASPYINSNDMVADVGCGPGNIGLELEKINWKGVLVGIDIAEKRLQEASSKPIYTSCVQANAYYLPFLDNYFDMVVSSGMVGLTGNCSIDEMRRIVKPGGYIACAVAEIKSLEWCKRRFRKATDYFNKLPNSEILACKDLGTGYASEYKDEHFVVYILKCY